uniref:ethanolamine kinase n=1 Tax=Buteo japonicus TaxID=224669 RepID=A0A8C0BMF2_9AVES
MSLFGKEISNNFTKRLGFESSLVDNFLSRCKNMFTSYIFFFQASHFFWGLWALIQAKYSTIDFDFLGYAIVRFNQYFKMKLEVMTLTLPE